MIIDIKSLIFIVAIAFILFFILMMIRKMSKKAGGSAGNALQVYVGNLPYKTSDEELLDLFQPYGNVLEVRVVKDRRSGRSKGYAFVTFASKHDAQNALAVHGQDCQGRALVVRIAKPRKS